MTEKYSNLRSIVANLGDPDILAEFDSRSEDAEIGRSALDARAWIPLCPAYPNLKGVSCDDIDNLMKTKTPDIFHSKAFYDFKKNMIAEDHSIKLTEKDFKKIYLDEHEELTDPEIDIDESIPFTEDYLHHVRVYDRDETYEAFQKIGHQIEDDMPGILHDRSTIFVTTPRGGYEMLSTFAYANKIRKSQIPSDISWYHEKRGGQSYVHEYEYRKNPYKEGMDEDDTYNTILYGTDWMNNITDQVKHVFIVDDIISSGSQIGITADQIRNMFPKADINSITLCKRDTVYPALPKAVSNYYTDTTTMGIKEFSELRKDGKPFGKEYITCCFPHAMPDGSSDKILGELMGNTRYPPERRIKPEDL